MRVFLLAAITLLFPLTSSAGNFSTETIKEVLIVSPSNLSKENKKILEYLLRQINLRPDVTTKNFLFGHTFNSTERKVCPTTHSIIQHSKCERMMWSFLTKRKAKHDVIVISIQEKGGYLGFWIKIFRPGMLSLLFVRHGKVLKTRTDACFQFVFKQYVKKLFKDGSAMDPDLATVSEVGEVSCLALKKRTIALTSQLLLESRGFMSSLLTFVRKKAYARGVIFDTPSKQDIKRTAQCKEVSTPCERDYAKSVGASSRISISSYRGSSDGKMGIQVKKFLPKNGKWKNESVDSFTLFLLPRALKVRACAQALKSSIYIWIISKKKEKMFLPVSCTNLPVTQRHQIIFVSGIVVASLGVILTASGIATSALAADRSDTFLSGYASARTHQEMIALNPLWDEGQSLNTMTGVFLGFGIGLVVAGGAGVVLGILNPFEKPQIPPPPASKKIKGSAILLYTAH